IAWLYKIFIIDQMKNIIRPFSISMIWLFAVLIGKETNAQSNTPTSTSQVPAASGTVTPNAPGIYDVSIPVNSIRTYIPRQPYTSESDVISSARQVQQVNRTTQFVDGLGRPIQSVTWQGSPAMKDVVTPMVYDQFNREIDKYLPYTSTDSNGTSSNNGLMKI